MYVAGGSNGATISEYDVNTGAVISKSLVAGLTQPTGMATSNNLLYIADINNQTNFTGSIGLYNATTGAVINRNLVTGLAGPYGIALNGNVLYAEGSHVGSGYYIATYNATTGAVINPTLIVEPGFPVGMTLANNVLYVANNGGSVNAYNASTGAAIFSVPADSPFDVAVRGNDLYASNYSTNTVGKYNATTGATINASFIQFTGSPQGSGLALSGNNLFVGEYNGGIGEYDATTGAAIKTSFAQSFVSFMTVSNVPEPGTLALFSVTAILVVGWKVRQSRRNATPPT